MTLRPAPGTIEDGGFGGGGFGDGGLEDGGFDDDGLDGALGESALPGDALGEAAAVVPGDAGGAAAGSPLPGSRAGASAPVACGPAAFGALAGWLDLPEQAAIIAIAAALHARIIGSVVTRARSSSPRGAWCRVAGAAAGGARLVCRASGYCWCRSTSAVAPGSTDAARDIP